jgi:mannose-6-phosphate isomerase-like protein (cupin superfamily)
MTDPRRLWAFGDFMHIVLGADQTGGRCFVMEQAVPRHVRAPGRHRHTHEDHVWLVREGSGRFWVGDEVTVAGPGAILWGPRGVPHAFSADTDVLRVVVVTLPAGLEAYFAAVGEPAGIDGPPPPGWTPPVEDEAAIAAGFGIKLLGPQAGWTPSRD